MFPKDFGYNNKFEVFQLLGAPLRIPGFILKVQLLSQCSLQVLQKLQLYHSLKHTLCNRLDKKYHHFLTLRTHLNPKLGCMNLTISNRISNVRISPSNRSLRSMYCTCVDDKNNYAKRSRRCFPLIGSQWNIRRYIFQMVGNAVAQILVA